MSAAEINTAEVPRDQKFAVDTIPQDAKPEPVGPPPIYRQIAAMPLEIDKVVDREFTADTTIARTLHVGIGGFNNVSLHYMHDSSKPKQRMSILLTRGQAEMPQEYNYKLLASLSDQRKDDPIFYCAWEVVRRTK